MRVKIAVFGAAAAVLVSAQVAAAHVYTEPAEVPAGGGLTAFVVPHGCEGSPTTSLSVQIPAGIAGVKPEVAPGWKISVQEGELPEPVDVFGEETTEGVTEVTWSGGSLEDWQLQRFGLSFVASGSLVGEMVWFPVVQRCKEGVERWVEVPVEGEAEPELPTPGVMIVAGGEDEHGAEAEEEGGSTTSEDEATETETSASESETVEATPASSSDDDGNGMDVVALGLGAAGVIIGAIALVVARRRPPQT
jgi:uncharacterized protein YcnI